MDTFQESASDSSLMVPEGTPQRRTDTANMHQTPVAPSLSSTTSTETKPAKPKQRRNRQQTSCVACHARKQKCNAREKMPCENCIKRNIGNQCYIAPPGANKNNDYNIEQGKYTRKRPREDDQEGLQARVQQLESALQRLAKSRENDYDTSASDAELVTSALGQLATQGTSNNNFPDSRVYLGRGSMIDLMRNAKVVGSSLVHNSSNDYRAINTIANNCFMSGQLNRHLIEGIPSDKLAPILINYYMDFHQYLMCYGASLEGPIYGQYYRLRSQNPTIESYALVSIIYMIFAIGVQFSDIDEEPEFFGDVTKNEAKLRFAALSKAALLQCEATEPPSLDRICALILHGTFAKSEGHPNEDFHLVGQAIRLAQSMGMHRESSKQWDIDSAEDERRRDMWWSLYVMDRILSFSFGRPYTIVDHHCDVALPKRMGRRLLLDLAKIIGDVIDECFSTKFPSYEKVAELDRRFQQLEQNIVQNEKPKGYMEEAMKIHALINCVWARSILHRPFLLCKGSVAPGTDDPAARSKLACVILSQKIIHLEKESLELLPRKFWIWYNLSYRILEAAVTLCVAIIQERYDHAKTERIDPWVLEARYLLDQIAKGSRVAAESVQTLDYVRNKYAPTYKLTAHKISIPYTGIVAVNSSIEEEEEAKQQELNEEHQHEHQQDGNKTYSNEQLCCDFLKGTIMTTKPLDIARLSKPVKRPDFDYLPLPGSASKDEDSDKTSAQSESTRPHSASSSTYYSQPAQNLQVPTPTSQGSGSTTSPNLHDAYGSCSNVVDSSSSNDTSPHESMTNIHDFNFDFQFPSVFTYFDQGKDDAGLNFTLGDLLAPAQPPPEQQHPETTATSTATSAHGHVPTSLGQAHTAPFMNHQQSNDRTSI